MLVVSTVRLRTELDDIKINTLDGGKLKLFKNDFTPTPATVIGDFIEADFSGYAAKTIAAFGAVHTNPDGSAEVASPLEQFDHSGGAVSNLVYGWWFETAAGVLIMSERFASAPIPMAVVGDSILLVLARTHNNKV